MPPSALIAAPLMTAASFEPTWVLAFARTEASAQMKSGARKRRFENLYRSEAYAAAASVSCASNRNCGRR